jgi:hypothetical protein
LTAAAAALNEYNNNGRVEQQDLDLVLLNWGADGASAPSTWTNDLPSGPIDQTELDRVLLNWGNTSASFAASAAVPEPGTVTLLVLASIVAVASGSGVFFCRGRSCTTSA